MPVKIRPATGAGSVALEAANGVSTDFTLTLPGATGTVLVSNSSSQTLFPDGTVSAPSISNDGDPNTGIYFPAADTIGFATNGAASMRLDASGNLGLGVTPSAWSAFKAVQVGHGALAATGTGSGQHNVSVAANAYFDGSSWRYITSSFATEYRQNAGSHQWFIAPSGSENDPISFFTQAMTLDTSGNLLVGTTSATGRLTVKTAADGSSGDFWGVNVVNSSNTIIFAVANNGSFYTGGAASSPYNNTTASAANVFIDSDNGLLKRSTSSRRYETNIVDAVHGLADLQKLRSVTYTGINDGDKVFGGLIAEEVDAAGLSEFVVYDDEGRPDALHYGNMAGLFVKAIQELAAKNADLEARLAALESK